MTHGHAVRNIKRAMDSINRVRGRSHTGGASGVCVPRCVYKDALLSLGMRKDPMEIQYKMDLIEAQVKELYGSLDAHPGKACHCRGVQGAFGDYVLALLETINKDISNGDLVISFRQDRHAPSNGVRG